MANSPNYTATKVAIGTTTITATCVHNPTVTDTCAVTVVA